MECANKVKYSVVVAIIAIYLIALASHDVVCFHHPAAQLTLLIDVFPGSHPALDQVFHLAIRENLEGL